MNTQANKNTKAVFKITVTAMLSALAAILMLIQFSVPFMPAFIKLDFSELPAVFASMIISPTSGVAVCLIKNLIHLPFTTTGCVGELSNFIIGAVFVLTTGLIYSKIKTKPGLIFSGVCGSVAMGCVSVPVNYFITYPMYTKMMPLQTIIDMYNKITGTDFQTLLPVLLAFNLPFNILKCILNVAIAVVMYNAVQPFVKKYV